MVQQAHMFQSAILVLGLGVVASGCGGGGGSDGLPGRDAASFVVANTQELVTVLANMPSTGGTVLLRAGTYQITAPIVVDQDAVVLEGEGSATVLRLASGANCPVVVLGEIATQTPSATHRNIVVRNLRIDANRQGQTQETCTIAGLGYLTKDTVYLIDLVEGNFPEDDPVRVAGERLQEKIRAGSLEFVIVQGDAADPATLAFIRAIEDEVHARDLVARRANVVSLLTLLGTYEVLKNGTVGALPVLLPAYLTGGDDARDHAPTSRDAIERAIDEMMASPAWGGVARLLVAPEKDVTVIVVVPEDDSTSLEAAQRLWTVMHDVLADADDARPSGVTAHVYGYRTIPYHFNVYSLKWLAILFGVSVVANVGLVAAFTRSWRATAAAAAPMVAASVMWAGLLAWTGTYVSIFLLFPMIFLTSIGSDYAAHLAWDFHEGRRAEDVFATTGRAVWWVMVTDAGAFATFTVMYLESAQVIMTGATLAIATAAVASVLVTPLFFGGGATARP